MMLEKAVSNAILKMGTQEKLYRSPDLREGWTGPWTSRKVFYVGERCNRRPDIQGSYSILNNGEVCIITVTSEKDISELQPWRRLN